MIAKEFEDFLLARLDNYLIPSDVVETVEDNANLNEVMHKLVNNPFLPVVDSQGIFKGIITRKSILKAVNSLLHDFTHDYIIIPKTTDNSDH